GDTVPGRQREPVVREPGAVGERDRPGLGAHDGRGRARDRDAVGGDALVRELLRGELAQTADHRVAERARGERRVGLDHGHGEARLEVAELAGAARAREASANDHDASRGRLSAGEVGTQRRRSRRSHAEAEKGAASGLRFCSAYQAAIAWISASVNPLAIRSMTVPARALERKSCMALTISARSRPASRATGDETRGEDG